jgi:hypothetical protein
VVILKDFDIVLTQNAQGEYGHLHHVFVHQCCVQHPNLITFADPGQGTEYCIPAGVYDLNELPQHRDIIQGFHTVRHANSYHIAPHVKSMLENNTRK